MSENQGQDTDAGRVTPGPQAYVVTYNHEHETIRAGDIVRVAEFQLEWYDKGSMVRHLIRDDMTSHLAYGKSGQYVHLRPISADELTRARVLPTQETDQ